MKESADLLKGDLSSYVVKAESFAKETGLSYSQSQMDAVTSLVFNGNRAYDSDSLLYYFLRNDKKGAMAILCKADKEGWYGNHGGLLRRRLMEFNIFFNNSYRFYEANELDILKKDTGFNI